MFKEKSTEKLIEYIQTLPGEEQALIVQRISKIKSKAGKKKAALIKKSTRSFQEMNNFLDSLGHRLPKNYKFNRQEANER